MTLDKIGPFIFCKVFLFYLPDKKLGNSRVPANERDCHCVIIVNHRLNITRKGRSSFLDRKFWLSFQICLTPVIAITLMQLIPNPFHSPYIANEITLKFWSFRQECQEVLHVVSKSLVGQVTS